MFKKAISTLFVALLATASLSAQAATLTYSGEVTATTGAFDALTPAGTPAAGPIEVDDGALAGGLIGITDILGINVNVGGFCFSTGADSSGCPVGGALVPITSIDSAAITGTSGTLGGSFSITAFSPTFNLSIPIFFDLDAGTFSAVSALGTVEGVGTLETAAPIPVPAAVWLFGSALLGLMGIRRRS